MKWITLLLSALLFFSVTANANHYTGAEISYEYTGTANKYRIQVKIYSTCETPGTNFPNGVNVNFSSSCSQSFTRPLTYIDSDSLQIFCAGVITPAH